MYEHKTKVRYTESGANGEMLLGAVVDCFQNVFHFEAEDASLDTQNLKKMNLGWFIYFWQIDIDRYPKCGEDITIGTFVYEDRGSSEGRNFYIKSASDDIIIRANSVWSLVDLTKLQIVRIPNQVMDRNRKMHEDKLDMENEVIRYLWDQGEELLNQSGTLIKNFVGGVAAWLLSFVAGLASGIINGFLGLIFAIYILADKEHLNYIYHRLLHAIFKDSVRERIEYIVRKIDRAFSGFFSGMLVEACILGSLCFVGLTIIGFFVGGMPYTLLISVLVGMCNMIPILGAYLSAIPSALLILLISPIKALIFVIFLVVVQQFEGNVIYPKVVGTSIGIGGMWVLFALTVGGNLMGIPGMVLGIPAFAVIYALVREFCDKRVAQKEAAGVAPAAEPAEQTGPAEEE